MSQTQQLTLVKAN